METFVSLSRAKESLEGQESARLAEGNAKVHVLAAS